MTSTAQKARIQNVYYTERAKSSIQDEPFFKFGEVVWGTGFVKVDSNGEVVFEDIPKNVSAVQGEVFRNEPIKNVANNKILLSATLPRSAVPDSNKMVTTLYQLDSKGNVIIVFLFAPVWTSADRDINLFGEIEIGDE